MSKESSDHAAHSYSRSVVDRRYLLRPLTAAWIEKELVNRRSWPSRLELQSALFEHIEAFYTVLSKREVASVVECSVATPCKPF